MAVLILTPSMKNQLRLRQRKGSDTNTGRFPAASYSPVSLDLPADSILSASALRTGIRQGYLATLEQGKGKSTKFASCLMVGIKPNNNKLRQLLLVSLECLMPTDKHLYKQILLLGDSTASLNKDFLKKKTSIGQKSHWQAKIKYGI